jgi:hypothetical protein
MSAHVWTVEWRTKPTRAWKAMQDYWTKNYHDACFDMRRMRSKARFNHLPYKYRIAKYVRVKWGK